MMPAIDEPTIETVRRPRRRMLILAATALATMLVPVGGEAIEAVSSESAQTSETAVMSWACAGAGGNLIGHSRPYLTGFTVASPASPFYAAPEGGSLSATLTVTSNDFDCDDGIEPGGRARYLTEDGSAVSPGDYAAIGPEWSDPMCVVNNVGSPHRTCAAGTQRTRAVPLTLVNDSALESAVESFQFRVVEGYPFPPATFQPFEAPVHIIDREAPDRVSLEPVLDGSQTMTYASGEPSTVRIPVFWAGPGEPQQAHYSVEPGTPAPTEGVDYRVESENPLPASAFDRAGNRLALIEIRILNNPGPDGRPAKELDEIINISLDPDPAYDLEADHDSTTLRILDGGSDTLAPRTRFHHPRHKKSYKRNAYQLREMHIFYQEPGGSGVKRVQIAISRKMKNGKCQWWNGNRFRGGGCNPVPSKFWKRTKYDGFVDWYLYRVPAFKPTEGTNIRFYRAYARGLDHAGNVEDSFLTKRNKNTFRIKR